MTKRSIIALSLAVVGLLMVGFVMLGSAGYYTAEGGDVDYDLVRKQLWCFAAGLALAIGCACLNYKRWMSLRWVLLGVAVVALGLCYVPGIGVKVNGSWRWIGSQSVRIQPSEFAKLALVIVIAAWYARYEPHTRTFWRGFAIPALMIGLVVGLIGGEMDLGGAAIAGSAGLGIMFVSGAKLRYLPVLGAIGTVVLVAMVATTPNRMNRVLGFASDIPFIAQRVDYKALSAEQKLEIESKKTQQKHAKLAFGSGGVEGVGPGMGRMKLFSLPEAHTDFILAMVGEELGLNGTLWIVVCYTLIVISGFCIAHSAPDRFGKLLAFGLTFLLGIQGLVNMGVVTSLLPNKGLVLPFVSYGRSNLLMSMVCIGILCNIHRLGGKVSVSSDLGTLRSKDRHTPFL